MSFEQRLHARCACGSVMSSRQASSGAADASSFVLRGTERVYERPRPFRIEHIALDLAIDDEAKAITGAAELSIQRVDPHATTLQLDAVGFDIAAVHVKATKRGKSWRAADFVYDDATLEVTIPAAVKAGLVRVRYGAQPRRGLYFLAPDAEVPNRPHQIWTQCQDEDARHIFPCHDKPHVKQTMDIELSVRPGWFALSNGDLRSGRAAQKKGRFRYRMNDRLPSYLFTIVAGDFEPIEATAGELPVTYYVPKGRREDGERTFENTPAMIELFGELTGVPYPWSKYAQIVVSDFIFGGMENTGATTMYEHILIDERAALDVTSDDLIAHELAHQWFGDLVTCRDWAHGWLNEGFATFFEHVWREHHLGEDEYRQGLTTDLNAYLHEANGRYKRPVVCMDYEVPLDLFDRHLYEKGGLFLHALRHRLGNELFWQGVNLYLTRHRDSVVETRDLMRAMEEVTGQSLEEVFEQGLMRAGHPRLDVRVRYEGGMLVVRVKQTLATDEKPWAVDLELDIVTPGSRRTRREKRRVDRRDQTFAIALPKRPSFVVVDPEQAVIGRVAVDAPADMVRTQLAEAPTARGRVLAAKVLGKRNDPRSIEALGKALAASRNFWGVRSAAAAALGSIRSPDAHARLTKAARTKNPKVRRAVARALGNFRNDEAAELLTKMARDDQSLLVASSACRALGATRRPLAYERLVELLDRDAWADILRAGAIAGLAACRDERALAPLTERTRYGVPTRARRAAIGALPDLSQDRATREHLEELLEDSDPYLRVAVVMALGEIGDGKSRAALRRQLERDLDGRVRRRIREVLKQLGGQDRQQIKRLSDELEVMRREYAQLKARLSKLEATVKKV
jgi:aminopeptidase N